MRKFFPVIVTRDQRGATAVLETCRLASWPGTFLQGAAQSREGGVRG